MLPQILPDTFTGTWIEGQSSDQYHADKTAVGSSSARLVLKSPYKFFYGFTDTDETEGTPSLMLGSVLHMALLEPKKFFSTYVRMPEFVGKTKDGRDSTQSAEAKAMREAWKKGLPSDAVILSDAEFAQIEGMINSVLSRQDASALLKAGTPEISGYYRDPKTGIKCKIRPDHLNLDRMTLIDVKTTQNCEFDSFSRSIEKYRYDFQMAMYCEGVKLITGKDVEYPVYIAIEKLPPYEIAIYIANKEMISRGRSDYHSSLKLLEDCLKKNHWPMRQNLSGTSMEEIGLPPWVKFENTIERGME